MAFHDVQLPVDVERGATGGPQFKTTILQLSSGNEQRNIDWEQARGRWDIGYGIQTKSDFDLALAFFYARQGQAHSFRFKDWSDFEITEETLGVTDASTNTFSLFKSYSSGGISFNRLLTKPVNGTFTAKVNGIAQTVTYDDTTPGVTEVSIILATGLVYIGATHAATTGYDVDVSLEFDVITRFDTDTFGLSLETFDAGAISSLPIIEVRDV